MHKHKVYLKVKCTEGYITECTDTYVKYYMNKISQFLNTSSFLVLQRAK